MKDLPLDKRGLPVPVIILKDKNGDHHFKMNNDVVVEQCIKDKTCTICGNPLGTDMWMIGGPMSAFHPNGAYIDAPVHKACGEYALQVCPYLAVSTYSGKPVKIPEGGVFDNMLFVNPTQSPDRVPFFVFSKISGYSVKRYGIERYIIPDKPYLEIEFWNDGEQLTREQAQNLVK